MRVPRDPMTDGPRPPVASSVWTPPAGSGPRPAAAPGAGQVLPFRRRIGLPVRRRSRLATFIRPFLLAVAIVGTPAVALWWSATSPRFALADLEVRGSERVSDPWVRAKLAHLVGRNLVWMPLGKVEDTLSGHPWVAGAEVTKELPDRLRVVVVERRPAALLEAGSGEGLPAGVAREGTLRWLDTDGRVIAPVLPGEEVDRDLLRLRWDRGRDAPSAGTGPEGDAERHRRTLVAALGAARALERAAPAWGRGLAVVEIVGEDEFRLEADPGGEGLPFPLLVRYTGNDAGEGVGDEEIASRVRRLKELLPELMAAEAAPPPALVDLRFRHRIVLRPARAEGAGREERGA